MKAIPWNLGDEVLFKPDKGKKKTATVKQVMGNGLLEVQIGNDPFPVTVRNDQVSVANGNRNVVESKKKVRKARADTKGSKQMTATTAKPSAKELRQKAQSLGVEGWAEMGKPELSKAIRKAEKSQNGKPKSSKAKTTKAKTAKAAPKATTTKKTTKSKPKRTKATTRPKTKAASKPSTASGERIQLAKSHPRPTPADGEIPFRKGSNLFPIAKLLLKGGVRETLAKKLAERVKLHPYQKEDKDIDLLDYDKRLLLCAQTMRDEYGYGIQRVGRGMSGTILVFRPGGAKDPRSKKGKKTAKK